MQFSFDTNLNKIAAKVEANERLTFDEGVALYNTDDLNALGKLADSVRRKKHGQTTYYNVNRHFNHTNICVADCKFCGFYQTRHDRKAHIRIRLRKESKLPETPWRKARRNCTSSAV